MLDILTDVLPSFLVIEYVVGLEVEEMPSTMLVMDYNDIYCFNRSTESQQYKDSL